MSIHHFRRLLASTLLLLIFALYFSSQIIPPFEVPTLEEASSSTKPVKAVNHRNATTTTTTVTSASNDTVLARAEVKDWFQPDRFTSVPFIERSCIYVEHICHSSGRWWYQPTVGSKQPEFKLLAELRGAPGYPKHVKVKAMDDSFMSDRKCPESPFPNHLVMHSLYNNMLGEFYARTLVGLHELARSQTEDFDDFAEQTQLYLHLYDQKPMLDSHHLFTDAFRSHPLLDFKSLLYNSGCRCVRRLILCGYDEAVDDGGNKLVSPALDGIKPQSARRRIEMYQELRETIRRRVIMDNPLVQKTY
jgi:hypothetical protein